MTADDFFAWVKAHESAHDAWGKFIVREVSNAVETEIGSDRFKGFFKVQPGCRVKAITSLTKKLSKKNYSEPHLQMTDLVGARFVVLLRTDIPIVEKAICSTTAWNVRKDRNPTDERLNAPQEFGYQSVHFILTNTHEREIEGVQMPAQIACEVQVRTVLQHAYAELGHDRIYKEEGTVPKTVHRLVAQCMALMETTDEIFCRAVAELDEVNRSRRQWAHDLDERYREARAEFEPTLDDEDAIDLLDTFKYLAIAAKRSEVITIPSARMSKIVGRATAENLFGKPVVLLIYWLVTNHNDEVSRDWPISRFRPDLELIQADLGNSA
jgi:putative GTP pyrophosphokinase